MSGPFIGFRDADELYQAGNASELFRHNVLHPGFADVSERINVLFRTLGSAAADEAYWGPLFRLWRHFRYLASVLPVGFGHSELWSLEASSHCERQLKIVDQVTTPEHAQVAREIHKGVTDLVASNDAPLRTALITIGKGHASTRGALLVQEPRFVKVASETIALYPVLCDLQIVTPTQLKEAKVFDRLYILGPSKWYLDPILTAPRSAQTHVVKYDWLHDRSTTSAVFDGVNETGFRKRMFHAVRGHSGVPRPQKEADWSPVVDWTRVVQAVSRRESDELDNVEARLYRLENAHAVFLEAASSVLALDVDVGRLDRTRVAQLEKGMYVALRTEGGGDYIVEVANQILASTFPNARELQRTWKSKLRAAVRRKGTGEVVRALSMRGAKRSNQTNVRNWSAERTIRPESDDDFKAILFYTGLRPEMDTYLSASAAIHAAHLRAATQIRRRLLAEVLKADFAILERDGRMNFELSGSEGGKLSLFRIRDVAPTTEQVSQWQAARPFRVKEALWLA